MEKVSKSTAEAPGQAAGYLYQLRYALYRALKRLLRDPTGTVGIERLDDIVVEANGTLLEIEQLKHSSTADVQFTDSSPAVWKSIGNWVRLVHHHELDLATLELVFVTNASVANDSGLSKLGPSEEDRDPAAALTTLTKAAVNSQNSASKTDRHTFLALDLVVQTALIRAIRVIPNSPDLAALTNEIEDIIHYACETEQLPDLRSELEGWWFDRISSFLSDGKGAQISLIDLDARVSYLREKYKLSFLQIDVEDPVDTLDNLDDYLFVKQVAVLQVATQRLRNAQRDFLKASAQRSKWLRASKIDPAELNKYDATLEERWSTQAAIMQDELPSPASDSDKQKCGRALLGWAETRQNPLRGATAQFLTSGSYHALADQIRLGWHPEFKQLFGSKS